MNKQAILLGYILGLTFGVIILLLLPYTFKKLCNPQIIVNRRDAVNHKYYQLDNGNGFWSDRELKYGQMVCTKTFQIVQPIP